MEGRLTVVLDLDGTLISSFTPRRLPSLPPGSTSYIVGKGAKLNPLGVLVVERPELQHFFTALSKFAGMQPHSCIGERFCNCIKFCWGAVSVLDGPYQG